MVEYTLTLNSEQAAELLKAVELLMRLKINQPKEISRAVMPENYRKNGEVDDKAFNDFLCRRDKADDYLELAFQLIFPTWDDVRKDKEWYRLYNIYQSVRYARHQAEFPNSTGVDSYPPLCLIDEPIPDCSWRKISD